MIEFRHYPLSKPLVVNGGEFAELIISSQIMVLIWLMKEQSWKS